MGRTTGVQASKSGPARRKSAASLASNTARNIGPYMSDEIGGADITDYSSITFDRVGKRMCLFGGGHGPSQETDIRVLDLNTLDWSSLYPTTKRAEMVEANGDSDLGRWISTNQPYARHTYNMTLVAGRRFYMFTWYGQVDHLDVPGPPYGGRACWYDFDAKSWSYSQYSEARTPWAYYCAAVLDPVSGKIMIAGYNPQAGPGNIWLYDPTNDTFTTGPAFPPEVGYAHDFIYFPPDDSFYVLQTDGRVWRVVLNRQNLSLTTVTALNVTGSRPAASSRCGFAYDSVNNVIGGNVTNGIIYTFDPASLAWSAITMQVEAGSIGIPNQVFHNLDFDAASGCYVFLGDPAAASTWLYRPATTRAQTTSTGVSDLSVKLDFGAGSVAMFSGANAIDQGDFQGEYVRQKCFLTTDSAFPDWRVYLRVDADAAGSRITGTGFRDEVVVEYGRSTSGKPQHLTRPYTATITKNGVAVATLTVPQHWWYARWRYQSSLRPVVRTPATLKTRGWIPNFGPSGLFGLQPNAQVVSWGGPMSAPLGFENVMGAAGDNMQIGLLTEYAADYVINGSAASLASLRTEGEWCGNWCMHIRDDASGAVLDVRGNALRYRSDGGTIDDAPAVDPATNPGFVAVEAAHFYPCANLGWLLTDDPYYLEELQFGCNWQLLFNQYHRNVQNLQGLVYPGQTRAYAWGLRDLFMLAASCPAIVPQWLRPSSYWRACVDDNRIYAQKYVDSPARIHALFKTWTRTDADPAWQTAWLNTVTGIALGQGFTEWQPIFAWGIDKHIQQTNGTSGWPREWPVPYYSIPNKAAVWGTPTTLFATTAVDATTCTNWSDYWAYYKSGSPDASGVLHSDANGRTINDSGWDGHTIMQSQSTPSYFLHLRAALAMAVAQGIPNAQASYDYLQGELSSNVMAHYNAVGQARFSIDPTLALASATAASQPASYEGLWWNAPAGSESGWGLNFEQQGSVIFVTWFTYAASGQPWWWSCTATQTSPNTYSGSVIETRGPPFDSIPFDPNLVSRANVGSATLTFSDSNNGSFAYQIGAISQVKSITREVYAAPLPACAFDSGTPSTEATNYQGLWWAEPAGSESGWGMSLTQQGGVIFAVWFTYDSTGAPIWLSITADTADQGVFSGALYVTTGPAFSAAAFDPNAVVRTVVGSGTLAFYNGDLGLFDYTYGSVSQNKRITRQVFSGSGTLCQ